MIEVLNIAVLVLRKSAKGIFEVAILILFFASIFLLLGKQLYKGVLTQKCVKTPKQNISDADYAFYIYNSSHWLEDKNGSGFYLCGNGTGARGCPFGYICLKGAEMNSFYVSNFNFYASSVIAISELMTLHFWKGLYHRMLLTAGTLHVTYFVLAFYTFYYLMGLIVALLSRSYKIVMMELLMSDKVAAVTVKNNVSRCESSKGIVKSPSCKSYDLFISHVKSIDHINHSISEDNLHTRNYSSQEGSQVLKKEECEFESKCHHTDKTRSRLSSENLSSQQYNSDVTNSHLSGIKCRSFVQNTLRSFMSSIFVEILILIIIFVNSAAMALQHSDMDQRFGNILRIIYYSFAAVSFVEAVLKIVGFGVHQYFRDPWNIFDFITITAAGIEMVLPLKDWQPVFLIIKVFKLTKLFEYSCSETCCYLTNAMFCILSMFRHPAIILIVFVTISVVTGMNLYGTEYFQSTDRFPDQESPQWFFKDCYSSFLLVFCMLCGDWKQPMVNAILFTSCVSDLLLLLFVFAGNLVVINLFLGIVCYTFYYKTFSVPTYAEDDNLHKTLNRIFCKFKEKDFPQVERRPETKEMKIEGITVGSSPPSLQKIITEGIGIEIYPRGRKKVQGNYRNGKEMEIIEDTASEYMADCCPSLCYFCCSFCRPDRNPLFWQTWADIRCRLYCLVETKVFRLAIMLVIILSIVILIAEKSYGYSEPLINKGNKIIGLSVMLIFIFEMLLKWMAYGLQKYFASPLGRLEFFIVMVYLADVLTMHLFTGQKNIFKSLKAFRLLSLLQLLKSYQELPKMTPFQPLPMKQSSYTLGSDNASRESLLRMRKIKCDHFLGRHCRYRQPEQQQIYTQDTDHIEWHRSTVCTPVVQYVDDKSSTSKRVSKERILPIHIFDCLPASCYNMCPYCKRNCMFWKNWKVLRENTVFLVENNIFIGSIMFLIIFSSLMLTTEDTIVSQHPSLSSVVSYADKIILAFFLLETFLKLLGYGIKKYFSYLWNILEFIVTVTSTSYVVLHELQIGYYPILKIIRIVRLLYLSRVLSFNKQTKLVLRAVGKSVPSYIITTFLCLFFWFAFAVMGVFIFKDKLHYCIVNQQKDSNDVKSDSPEGSCHFTNGTVKTTAINFNNVGSSYLVLLQIATLQNWMSLVTNTLHNSDVDDYIVAKISTVIYIPTFIAFSTFLTLNFFLGVTLRCFRKLKKDEKELENSSLKLYHSALEKMKKIKLSKVIPQPNFPLFAFVYRMVMSDNFEVAGFVFIGLHMLLIALDMYDPDPSEMFALAMIELNIFFIIIFSVECVLKLIAQRLYFFKEPWNFFDVIVLALCIVGILYEETLFFSPMLPPMLRLVRFIKALRYLRKYMRGIIPLISSLFMCIPAMIALISLQFLIMTIYAVLGMHFFKSIHSHNTISDELNFETFLKSMLLLFQLSTLSGWQDVLLALSDTSSCHDKKFQNNGYCGNVVLAVVFIVSYIIIVYFITIKTHLVVILDNFECSMKELENIPLREDYKMFAEIWQKFDTGATGIIRFKKLSDLIDVLEEPFHFEKPNRFLIVSLNIPIYEGDLIFYGDVMDALTRDFMIQRGHSLNVPENVPGILDKNGHVLQKISSTLWRQRQNFCAHVIQFAWKRYRGHSTRASSPIFYSEVRLSSQGDKVDTFLAPHDCFVDHASV